MRLFIVASVLSLLALSGYAHAAAAVVGYPYRTELLAYSPTSGEFSNVVGNSLAHTHGYVRYLDQQGVQHIIGYKYPEPVQQSRRLTNEEYLKQLVKGSLNKDETERNKARDEHFRLWSMNQYDQYRQEIERLKAAGQEPTTDLLSKVKAYEDIVVAARRGEASSDAAETTQLQQVRDEHLRLWNAQTALLGSAQMLEQQQTIGAQVAGFNTPASTSAIHSNFESARVDVKSHGAVPTLASATAQAANIGETAEQKKAREEHLRNYQEQLQRLQQAHAEAAKATEGTSSADAPQQAKDARTQYVPHADAQQPHVQPSQEMQIVEHFSYIQETPEVQRAKAEHLRLWQEAKQRAEKEAENENKVNSNEAGTHHHHTEGHFGTKSVTQSGFTSQEKQVEQQQQGVKKFAEEQKQLELTDRSDTVTIFAAAQDNQKYQEKLYGHQQQQQQTYVAPIEHNAQLPTPVQDTPEVQRARAEHLKILEELQKQAEFNAEKLRDGFKSSAEGGKHSTVLKQTHYTPATAAANNEQGATKTLASVGQQESQLNAAHQAQTPAVAVQDTIEVQRAREEHLKLLQEAFTKASEYQTANAAKTSTNTNEPLAAPYASPATDKLATESLNNNESAEETRLRIEEAKQREAERLAEETRLKEEARLQAEELKRLQLEEERRQAQERLEQARLEQTAEEKKKDDAHYAERPQLPIVEEQATKQALNQLSQAQMSSESAGLNAQMLRFGGNQQAGAAGIPTTAYYIGASQPLAGQQAQLNQLQKPGYYYMRDVTNGYLNVDKPYFLQYIPNQQQQQQLASKDTYTPTDAIPLTSALAALNQIQNYEKPLAAAVSPFSAAPIPLAQATATAFAPSGAPITAGPVLFPPARAPIAAVPFAAIAPSASLASIASFSPSSETMKIDYGNNPGLAALEKATREHFRAHELALEQLRFANQKQTAQKDCS